MLLDFGFGLDLCWFNDRKPTSSLLSSITWAGGLIDFWFLICFYFIIATWPSWHAFCGIETCLFSFCSDDLKFYAPLTLHSSFDDYSRRPCKLICGTSLFSSFLSWMLTELSLLNLASISFWALKGIWFIEFLSSCKLIDELPTIGLLCFLADLLMIISGLNPESSDRFNDSSFLAY